MAHPGADADADGRFGRLGGGVLRDAGIPPQDAAQAVPLGRAGHYGGTGGAGRVSYLVPVKEIKEAGSNALRILFK